MVPNPGQTHNMVSDINDPGASTSASSPPTVPLEEMMGRMMHELQHLRAANEVLHGQVQGLLAMGAPAQAQNQPAQLPIQLSDEVAQLWFVENLEDDYHQLANQYRVAHPDCNLQDIIQYLRMINVDGRGRGLRQATPTKSTATPMEVDLAALRTQVAALERQVRGQQEEDAASVHINRLTAEEIQEHRENMLVC